MSFGFDAILSLVSSRAPSAAATLPASSPSSSPSLSSLSASASSYIIAALTPYLFYPHTHRPHWSRIVISTLTSASLVYISVPMFSSFFFPASLRGVVAGSGGKLPGRYTVGLSNHGNDCFANSNLQALAAMRLLYTYLVDVVSEFESIVDANRDKVDAMLKSGEITLTKSKGNGMVMPMLNSNNNYISVYDFKQVSFTLTRALLAFILELNEPIVSSKIVSPWKLLRVLEQIYKSRISRNQHDAHELLHLILETLANEHELANKNISKLLHSTEPLSDSTLSDSTWSDPLSDSHSSNSHSSNSHSSDSHSSNSSNPSPLPAFTFEGSIVDQIKCSRCGYIPPTKSSTFLVLSLMVPQRRSVSLEDLLLESYGGGSPEYIQDYGCVACRLKYVNDHPASMTPHIPPEIRDQLLKYLKNPANLPHDLEDTYLAQLKSVTSPITKSTQFDHLPQALTIHLSRSIYSGTNASRNSCRVILSELIQLVGANDEVVKYKLVAMIRHKGTHYAGHYECFKRKHIKWWQRVYEQRKEAETAEALAKMVNNKTGTAEKDEEGTVKAEEGTVETEEGTVETEEGTVETEEGTVETEEGTIESDISDVEKDAAEEGTSDIEQGTVEADPVETVKVDNSDTPLPVIKSTFSNLPPSMPPFKSRANTSLSIPCDLQYQIAIGDNNHESKVSANSIIIGTKTSSMSLASLATAASIKSNQSAPSRSLSINSESSSGLSSSTNSLESLGSLKKGKETTMTSEEATTTTTTIYTDTTTVDAEDEDSVTDITATTTAIATATATPTATASETSLTTTTTTTITSTIIKTKKKSDKACWRISDNKTWECKVKDILREESGAYLLFYERV